MKHILPWLLLAAPFAIAGRKTVTYSNTEVCVTHLGSASTSPVLHTTIATKIYDVVRVTYTSTPTTTIIPSPTTVTETSIVLRTSTQSLSEVTDTVTKTSIATTTTALIAATPTTSTTVTQITTLIITRSFQGIQSSLPGATEVANPDASKAPKHRSSKPAPPLPSGFARRGTPAQKKNDLQSKGYPEAVTCSKMAFVQVTRGTTVRASKTSTTTAPTPAITQTTTSTLTITSTSAPARASTTDVTNTITVTETVISEPATVTSTQTTFITATSTQAITAAQCSPNNFADAYIGWADAYNGYGISTQFGSSDFATQPNVSTALGCCQQCALNNLCAVWAYDDRPGAGCYCFNEYSCSSEGQYPFTAGWGGKPGYGFTIGNGRCGEYTTPGY